MTEELEFLVLEGQAKGDVFALRAEQVELGRRDPRSPQDPPERISFPDPTVSSLHATLSWDGKRNRYLLHHKSTTNHTLINGKVVAESQYIHVGDKIKMGTLVIQLRLIAKSTKASAAEAPVPIRTPGGISVDSPAATSELQVLILNGPEAGRLQPMLQETLILQEPGSQQTFEPTLNVPGAGNTRCLLLQKGPDIHVTCAETGLRPVLIDQPIPGVIRQRNPGPEFGNLLTPESLLVVGKIAVMVVSASQAAEARARLLAGEVISPLQSGLFREGDRVWNRGEQHLLRFVAGPLKGTHFWVDPRQMNSAISLGRIGQRTLVELTDRGAVSCEIRFQDEEMVLTNIDAELNLPLNHEEIPPGQSENLSSGDQFRLGRTLIRYEYAPVQQRLQAYSLFVNGREHALRRSVTVIGNGPHCDLSIEDDRLASLVGKLVVSETSIRYQHRLPGVAIRIQGQEVSAGQDTPLRMDHTIELFPGLELRLGRRSSSLAESGES